MKKNLLSTKFCQVNFPTPLISVSGIVESLDENLKLAKIKGVGGITTKSISLLPRVGNPPPIIVSYQIGYLNAVGLRNPGVKKAKKEITLFKKKVKKPIIASIFAGQLSEFSILAQKIAKSNPDLIELNLSCPNVDDEFGKPFAIDPLLSALAVIEVKKVVKKIPIIAKLSPNTPDLKKVCFEIEQAGVDAISAINTVGPGMILDFNKRKSFLSHGVGGVSGAAIKPIALRCINDIYKTVKIPIIGMGGVGSGKDVLEMIMAGATLVGIGSAIYKDGYSIFDKVLTQVEDLMKENKIKTLKSIRGIIT